MAFVAYLAKALTLATVGSSQFLTALAYSSPVIERSLGRNALTLGLRGLSAGLEAAATEGGNVVASQAMKRVGVWMLRLAGWEVAVVLLGIEIFVWAISPNDLETWCMANAFGKKGSKALGGTRMSSNSYVNSLKQQLAFEKAIGSVSVRSQ